MRFKIGDPPVEQRLTPKVKGWQEMSALGAKAVQTYGLIVSCVGMLFVGVVLRWAIHPSSIWATILILVTILPLHELVHALTTPAWGLSDRTVIGFHRGKGLMLPYMYFDGVQPLWRMLLTGLTPVLLLTVLPVMIIHFAPLRAAVRADLGFLAFFNVGISGGDLVMFYWLITHLPLQATVKGNGWDLLWRDQADGSDRFR